MPFVICEKALLDIGPEKNGTIEPSFRGTDLSNALISVKYSPFGPQNRYLGRKTTEREKSQDCVAEGIEFELVVPFALPKGITRRSFGEVRCDLLRALR